MVEYVSTNIERKCQLPLDSTMFDFQVHWKGKLITRISGVSISSPMGTGVMLEILGFLGNHVLPKFIFKNNPNKHQSHMEELSCFAFFGFFALFAFFCFFLLFYVLELGLEPRTLHMRVTFLSTYLVLLKMEKIKCELEKHSNFVSCFWFCSMLFNEHRKKFLTNMSTNFPACCLVWGHRSWVECGLLFFWSIWTRTFLFCLTKHWEHFSIKITASCIKQT